TDHLETHTQVLWKHTHSSFGNTHIDNLETHTKWPNTSLSHTHTPTHTHTHTTTHTHTHTHINSLIYMHTPHLHTLHVHTPHTPHTDSQLVHHCSNISQYIWMIIVL